MKASSRLTVLEELKMLGGEDDPTFLDEVIEQFLQDVPLRIEEIRHALESADGQALVLPAHALKGSVCNVGATAVSALSLTLEEAGHSKGMLELRERFTELEEAWERTRHALQEEQSGLVNVT